MTVRRRLLPALARYRWRPVLLLALTAVVFAAAYAALATITASFHAAVEESVLADQAGRSHSVQVVNEAVGLPPVARAAGLAPVRDTGGILTGTDGRVPVTVRVTRDAGLPLGLLSAGRRQQSPNEITVSQAVARDTATTIGARVQVATGQEAATGKVVVGITVDPADDSDATVVTLDPELTPQQATVWFDDQDSFARPELQDVFASRSVTGRTTGLLAAERAQREKVPGLDYAAPALAVLMLAVLLSLIAALRPIGARDVAALEGAGMARRSGWLLVASLLGVAVLVGIAAGYVLGVPTVALARGPLSARLGQDWQQVAVPGVPLAALPIAIILSAALAAAVGRAARLLQQRRTSTEWAGQALQRVSLSFLALAAVLYALSIAQFLPTGASTLAGALAALGAPAALVRLSGRGQPPTTAKLLRVLGSHLVVLATAVTFLAWATGLYAAREVHNAAASDRLSSPYQPAGSLLVLEIPRRGAETLTAAYPGRDVRAFEVPDESASQLRVTGTALLQCLGRRPGADPNQLPPQCYPQDTSSPVNRVMLATDEGDSVAADPGLIVQGRVGLLRFRTGSAAVIELADSTAAPDPQLGGNMPGMVVPPNSPLATRLHLRASGGRLIAFLDFSTLSPRDQARFRAEITRVAPAAQVAEDSGGTNEVARSIANAVAIGGLALTSMILMLGGLATVSAERRLRRLLVDMGAGIHQRRMITLRWILVPAGGLVAAAAAALLSAWITGIHDGRQDFGWIWCAPAAGGVLTCVFLAARFIRVPKRIGE